MLVMTKWMSSLAGPAAGAIARGSAPLQIRLRAFFYNGGPAAARYRVWISMSRSIAVRAPVIGTLQSRWSLRLIVTAGSAITVALVPFLAYAINTLHSFYDVGNAFHDAGWSAYLIHDGDLLLHQPPSVEHGSWFYFHISPLFVATSAFGYLLPLTRIQFYAAYVGISHALPAIAVFWLLTSGYRMTRPAARCALVATWLLRPGPSWSVARSFWSWLSSAVARVTEPRGTGDLTTSRSDLFLCGRAAP